MALDAKTPKLHSRSQVHARRRKRSPRDLRTPKNGLYELGWIAVPPTRDPRVKRGRAMVRRESRRRFVLPRRDMAGRERETPVPASSVKRYHFPPLPNGPPRMALCPHAATGIFGTQARGAARLPALLAEVALDHVGLIPGMEMSRRAAAARSRRFAPCGVLTASVVAASAGGCGH
jgi:hypothetical protein